MDAAGAPASPIFEASPVTKFRSLGLQPLLDGSLALQVDGVWTSILPGRATAPQLLPDWVASRPSASFALVRGDNAYAAFSQAASCGPIQVELLGRSGRSCGSAEVAVPSGCTLAANVGLDGTLIVSGDFSDRSICLSSYWPALLK